MHNKNISLKNILDNTTQISVVVQGAITEFTGRTLESIRKYLPESKIILSTWEGSPLENLDFDELILNKDP